MKKYFDIINNGYGVHCTEEGVKSYVAMNE